MVWELTNLTFDLSFIFPWQSTSKGIIKKPVVMAETDTIPSVTRKETQRIPLVRGVPFETALPTL